MDAARYDNLPGALVCRECGQLIGLKLVDSGELLTWSCPNPDCDTHVTIYRDGTLDWWNGSRPKEE